MTRTLTWLAIVCASLWTLTGSAQERRLKVHISVDMEGVGGVVTGGVGGVIGGAHGAIRPRVTPTMRAETSILSASMRSRRSRQVDASSGRARRSLAL